MQIESKWKDSDTVIMDTYLLRPTSECTSKEADTRIRIAIENDGLHTPLSVALIDGEYLVIMGNRRLRALEEMGYFKVPVNVFASIKEAEEFGMKCRKLNRGMK